jgi:hypothetical protein
MSLGEQQAGSVATDSLTWHAGSMLAASRQGHAWQAVPQEEAKINR